MFDSSRHASQARPASAEPLLLHRPSADPQRIRCVRVRPQLERSEPQTQTQQPQQEQLQRWRLWLCVASLEPSRRWRRQQQQLAPLVCLVRVVCVVVCLLLQHWQPALPPPSPLFPPGVSSLPGRPRCPLHRSPGSWSPCRRARDRSLQRRRRRRCEMRWQSLPLPLPQQRRP